MKTTISFLFILILSVSVFGQTSEGTFEKIKLTDIGSILIPSTMELQSGSYKDFSNALSKELLAKQGVEVTGDSIIFQQKGLNEFSKSTTYARVMIKTTLGKNNEYRKLTSKINISKDQLKLLDANTKTEIEASIKAAGIGLKLVRWDGVTIETLNGRSAIKIAYSRQLNNNPSVYVELYYIENFDREYELTISYREQDASIWKDALQTTKNSFTITNVR